MQNLFFFSSAVTCLATESELSALSVFPILLLFLLLLLLVVVERSVIVIVQATCAYPTASGRKSITSSSSSSSSCSCSCSCCSGGSDSRTV
jgi:hypothetical protein